MKIKIDSCKQKKIALVTPKLSKSKKLKSNLTKAKDHKVVSDNDLKQLAQEFLNHKNKSCVDKIYKTASSRPNKFQIVSQVTPAKSLGKFNMEKASVQRLISKTSSTKQIKNIKLGEKSFDVNTTSNSPNNHSQLHKKEIMSPELTTNKTTKKKSKSEVQHTSNRKSKKTKIQPLGNLLNNSSKLSSDKVFAAVSGLLKLASDESNGKSGFLDIAEPIFLQVECIKIPICPTKLIRFKLPHPLVDKMSDVLLITADKKGAKIHPEKGVEHYTELLTKHDIDFVHKVMPLRMIRQEYSQYEMRKKLVDQFDLILADACVARSLPKLLGKFILYNRKMPIPVHLDRQNLKEHLQTAISKSQMVIKANGHVSVVQVGHSKMGENEITANIIEVGKWLVELFPGGWENIRSLNVKTSSSKSLPIYLSLLSPNVVRIPVEQPKKKAEVEDELSTMPGMNVIVKSDGTVILKKVKEENLIDDSHDAEILEEAEKYMQSSKTVRYGDSDDDSDKEADAVTAAVEQEFLSNYGSNLKPTDDEEGEEEEESSDEEEEVPPISAKKMKMVPAKNQPGGKSHNKKQKITQKQEKVKTKSPSSQKGAMSAQVNKDKNPRRGSRGGKKNKVSKDQRKALIKRQKAGKK